MTHAPITQYVKCASKAWESGWSILLHLAHAIPEKHGVETSLEIPQEKLSNDCFKQLRTQGKELWKYLKPLEPSFQDGESLACLKPWQLGSVSFVYPPEVDLNELLRVIKLWEQIDFTDRDEWDRKFVEPMTQHAAVWRDRFKRLKGKQSVSSGNLEDNERVTTQEVAERLERLRSQGEPFRSQGAYAKQFGCSKATINKAIKQTSSLQTWAGLDKIKAPKAQSLTDIVTDAKPQEREPDPADCMPAEDVDKILEHLVSKTPPDKLDELRQQLDAKTQDDRHKLAVVIADNPYLGDRILGRRP